MELKLENDFLAVVNKDRYLELRRKAEENENVKEPAFDVALQAIAAGIVIGTVTYVGYQAMIGMRADEKRYDLCKEENSLRDMLEELKRETGHGN